MHVHLGVLTYTPRNGHFPIAGVAYEAKLQLVVSHLSEICFAHETRDVFSPLFAFSFRTF